MVARWVEEKNKWLHVSKGLPCQRTFFHFHNNSRVNFSDFLNKLFVSMQRQPVKQGPNAEDDVRGPVSSGPIPQSDTEPVRLAVRRTMK